MRKRRLISKLLIATCIIGAVVTGCGKGKTKDKTEEDVYVRKNYVSYVDIVLPKRLYEGVDIINYDEYIESENDAGGLMSFKEGVYESIGMGRYIYTDINNIFIAFMNDVDLEYDARYLTDVNSLETMVYNLGFMGAKNFISSGTASYVEKDGIITCTVPVIFDLEKLEDCEIGVPYTKGYLFIMQNEITQAIGVIGCNNEALTEKEMTDIAKNTFMTDNVSSIYDNKDTDVEVYESTNEVDGTVIKTKKPSVLKHLSGDTIFREEFFGDNAGLTFTYNDDTYVNAMLGYDYIKLETDRELTEEELDLKVDPVVQCLFTKTGWEYNEAIISYRETKEINGKEWRTCFIEFDILKFAVYYRQEGKYIVIPAAYARYYDSPIFNEHLCQLVENLLLDNIEIYESEDAPVSIGDEIQQLPE